MKMKKRTAAAAVIIGILCAGLVSAGLTASAGEGPVSTEGQAASASPIVPAVSERGAVIGNRSAAKRQEAIERHAAAERQAQGDMHPEPAPDVEKSEKTEKAALEDVDNCPSVCIDPGHQGEWVDMSAQEPAAPGSSEMKAKATTGTQGKFTGMPEYQLNLDISLLLRNELERRGYRVVLTRKDNDTAISNIERAQLASDENCDVLIRIHANGSDDPSVNGALAMISTPDNPYVGNLFGQSQELAQDVLDSYCEQTGFKNLGIQNTDSMTGINWSKVPVMILEMGFMTNEADDTVMQNPDKRGAMVNGIADGIDRYFETENPAEPAEENIPQQTAEVLPEEKASGEASEKASEEAPGEASEEAPGEAAEQTSEMEPGKNASPAENIEELGGPAAKIYDSFLAGREQNGEKWTVSMEDLKSGRIYEYNGSSPMQSASVIKVFIMATVYDRIIYPAGGQSPYQESYPGELNDLLHSMITVSDNDAANRLIEICGGGDFAAGAAVIGQFCQENGFPQTSVGRRFLESNPTGDNYTSAADCRRILAEIYNGECVNAEASAQMLELLREQTVTYKIPAGLPQGFTSANKTGEMPEGYGLGCIENDIAIIFSPYGDYVLAVLSNNLGGRNLEAQDVIRQISAYTANWVSSF